MIASSAWGGSTYKGHNYASLLWSRIFQGVALAPFEALVNACVGDLYYVHERGVRTGYHEHVSLWRSLPDTGLCGNDICSYGLAMECEYLVLLHEMLRIVRDGLRTAALHDPRLFCVYSVPGEGILTMDF